MFCSNCGRQISDRSKFCAHCGHAVGSVQNPQQLHHNRTQFSAHNQPGAWNMHQGGGGSHPRRAAGAAFHAGRGAVRTAGHAGMHKMLLALTALVLILLVLFYNLFIKSGKPEDTLADLEKAMNNLDTEAMLECFDGQTQKLYSGSMGMAGSFLGFDLGAASDLATGLGGIMAGAGLAPKFTVDVQDIEYSARDTCMATVDITVSYEGMTESENMQLPMKKDGRKWVISMGALGDFMNY